MAGLSLCLRQAQAPALAGLGGCLAVPGEVGRGGTTLDSSGKGHCPSHFSLTGHRPLQRPQTFSVPTRAPILRLPVEECSRRGPSTVAPLEPSTGCAQLGLPLRISLSWANTASPALQILSPPPSPRPSPLSYVNQVGTQGNIEVIQQLGPELFASNSILYFCKCVKCKMCPQQKNDSSHVLAACQQTLERGS